MEQIKKGGMLKAAILSFVFACATALCVAMPSQAWAAPEPVGTAAELQNAIDSGAEEIKLTASFEASDTITVPAGKTVTLDLNGQSVTMVRTDKITKNDALIRNKGNLTIKDSSGTNAGKLSYKYDGPTAGWQAAVTISNDQGVLTLKSGTVESLSLSTNSNGNSTNVYKFAIDNLTNGNNGDAILNVEGGVVTAAKGGSLRGFANSTTCTNAINISGGSMVGQVWLQDPNAKQNKGSMNIIGGEISANATDVDAVYLYGVGDASGMSVSISGNVTVNGSTYLTSVDTTSPFSAEIEGGTFNGDVWVCTWVDESVEDNIPAISGGTFAEGVGVEYLAAGSAALVDENGSAKVLSDAKAAEQAKAYVEVDGVKTYYTSKAAAESDAPGQTVVEINKSEGGQGTAAPSAPSGEADDVEDSKESEKTSTPKTGDAAPLAAAGFGLVALIAAGALVATRKVL